MTQLMRELLKDPTAVFEISADFPSGNGIDGTIGPIAHGKLAAQVIFRQNPPSEADIALARDCMDSAIGKTSAVAIVSDSSEEHEESAKICRRFLNSDQN